MLGKDTKQIVFNDFSGGVNNRARPTKIAPNEAVTCKDLVHDESGGLQIRPGFREGKSLTPTHVGTPIGLVNFMRDSTKYWVVIDDQGNMHEGTGATIANVSFTDNSENLFGSTSPEKPCMVAYRGYLYLATVDGVKRFDGADNADSGLALVGNISPASSSDTGGNMDEGDYYYAFSYGYGDEDELGVGYIDLDNVYQATVGAGDSEINLTSLNASGDHVNRIHIWRSVVGASEYGPYYYVGATDDAADTTYTDQLSDFDLRRGHVHDKYEEGTPPGAKWICVHKDRMFFLNSKYPQSESNTNVRGMRFYWSEVGQPDYVLSDNNHEIASVTGDEIVGAKSYRGVLAIFTKRTIFLLSGNSADNFSLSEADGAPCLSGWTICNVNGELYFLAPDGVRAFNGATNRLVSKSWRVPYADLGKYQNAHAVYDPRRRLYICTSYTDDDVSFMMDVDTGAVYYIGAGGASPTTVMPVDGGIIYTDFHVGTGSAREPQVLLLARTYSTKYHIWTFEEDDYRDDVFNGSAVKTTANIRGVYAGPEIDFSDREIMQKGMKAVAYFDNTPKSDATSDYFRLYGDGSEIEEGTASAQRWRLGCAGDEVRRHQLRLAWQADDERSILEQLVFQYRELPKRFD